MKDDDNIYFLEGSQIRLLEDIRNMVTSAFTRAVEKKEIEEFKNFNRLQKLCDKVIAINRRRSRLVEKACLTTLVLEKST
jgi:hypothetical protein